MDKLLEKIHKIDSKIPLTQCDELFSIGNEKHRVIFTVEKGFKIHMVQTFIDSKPCLIIEGFNSDSPKTFFWLSGFDLINKFFKDKQEIKQEFIFKMEEYLLKSI